MAKKSSDAWAPWLFLGIALAMWEGICRLFNVSNFTFPTLSSTLAALWEFRGPIAEHALQTFWTTLAGFLIGVVVGVILGFVIGSSRFMYHGLYPLMIAFNSIPKAAFVPILVVWFGIGTVPAILTAFLISFFPIVVNVATGLATLEPELADVLHALGASRFDVLTKVGLPRSMPFFFASLKVAITLAFVGAVISEIVASNLGIGYLMSSAGSSMRMSLVFAGLIYVFAFEQGRFSAALHRPWAQALGLWSYSIYMVHMLLFAILKIALTFAAKVPGLGLTSPVVHPVKLWTFGHPVLDLLLMAFELALVVVTARFTYAAIEAPARRVFGGIAERYEHRIPAARVRLALGR